MKLETACLATFDPPKASPPAEAIKDKHQRIINGILDVGRTRFGKAQGMRVKGAHNVLAENFGCRNHPSNIGNREDKTPSAAANIACSHESKVMASVNDQPTNFPAAASAPGLAHLTQYAAVLNFVDQVHCREDA